MSEIDDKQKLVNLNDLKYVRAYIDQRVDEKDAANEAFKAQIQEDIPNQVKESVETEVASQLDAVNTEITNIKDGTTIVAKATNAEHSRTAIVAAYASDDTSKGTIEERLTKQGFNEGSASLGPGISATQNKLTRQGHHAIFRFEGTCAGEGGGESGVYYFTLPDGFIPNETFNIRIMTLVDGLAISQITAATLMVKKGNPVAELWYYYIGGTVRPLTFQVGYETVPVTTGDGGWSGGDDDDTTMEV